MIVPDQDPTSTRTRSSGYTSQDPSFREQASNRSFHVCCQEMTSEGEAQRWTGGGKYWSSRRSSSDCMVWSPGRWRECTVDSFFRNVDEEENDLKSCWSGLIEWRYNVGKDVPSANGLYLGLDKGGRKQFAFAEWAIYCLFGAEIWIAAVARRDGIWSPVVRRS